MTGVACGAGYAYPFRAPDFTSGFHRGSRCPITCFSFHVIVLSFEFCLIAWYLYILKLYETDYEKNKDVN